MVGTVKAGLQATVARCADTVALEIPDQGVVLTYAELVACAERWRSLEGIEHRTVVVSLPKCAEYYGLALGALLNEWSFCPLDTSNPVDRIARVADQLGDPIVVVDDDDVAAALTSSGFDVRTPQSLAASSPSSSRDAARSHSPLPRRRYYIATSGTTGTPKLVEVDHEATETFVRWAVPFYAVDRSSRWSQFSSIGFDLSVVDMLVAWTAGATLVAVSTMAERARLHRFAATQRITHWHSVPSMIGNLVRGGALPDLEVVSLCGEPLLPSDAVALRTAAPTARVVNTYGPTEGPLFCTYHEVDDADLSDASLATLPIGEPIPGYQLETIDDSAGSRLSILADRLAEGYHGIDDPAFATVERGGRLMRSFDTGDYVERRNEKLCFSHRRDGQVKLAGVRVELGEVTEACARAGLDQPAVIVHDGRLVVFYEGVGARKAALDDTARQHVIDRLRQLLPTVAVPADFRHLHELPHNLSGKVDRGALARLAEAAENRQGRAR